MAAVIVNQLKIEMELNATTAGAVTHPTTGLWISTARMRVAIARYGFAIVVVWAAAGGGWMLRPVLSPSVSPFFYLAVILATWYGGLGPGLLATALSGFITAYLFMSPMFSLRIGVHDVLRLAVFTSEAVVIGSLVSNRRRAEMRLSQARDELESRVRERTAKLQVRTAELQVTNDELHRQFAERRKMQQAILDISEREQQRIGHDLHDGLGQELTGIAFICKALAEDLSEANRPEGPVALEVVGRVNHTISQARELARGLFPAELETEGLGTVLRQLCVRVEKLFNVECDLDDTAVTQLRDTSIKRHLYRIAQESISNAIKHGHAHHLHLKLREAGDHFIMTVSDDGAGFTPPPDGHVGMGLRLMSYRANMIGGSLQVRRSGDRGTQVICTWPIALPAQQEGHHNDPA